MQVKSKSVSSAKSEQRKQRLQNNYGFSSLNIILLPLIIVGLGLIINSNFKRVNLNTISKSKFADILKRNFPTPSPSPIPTPSPSPTPRPLTFAEMNSLYGPCIRLPVLMYHHIQSKESAVINKQTSLTVYTDIFKTQMEYLKAKNYNTLTMSDLINFFDNGTPIPAKSILLTFDDGYQDFFTDAYPILSGIGFHSTVYIPTGLMQNPDYLTWNEVASMNPWVLFGNHTWSHKSVVTEEKVMKSEISTADTQLIDHSLNSPKTFAYPYGPDSVASENYLNSLNYKLAFTTRNGNILCKKQRLNLPRIRIGNTSMSYYGF